MKNKFKATEVKLMIAAIVITICIGQSCSKVEPMQTEQTIRITDKQTSKSETLSAPSAPYIILISADGFRHDYANLHGATNILSLSAGGVSAESMIPSFPTFTHPNHYTLVTGFYPGHTGIVGNSFYDPTTKQFYQKGQKKWFTKESIWRTASKSGMHTANINYWNGQVINAGDDKVYQVSNAAGITIDGQLNAIKFWLNKSSATRPHLITLYYNAADHEGHLHGPNSMNVKNSVRTIDNYVKRIDSLVKTFDLPINIIFLSDHGMIGVDSKHILTVPVIDKNKFVVNNQKTMINLYAKDRSYIQDTYTQLRNNANGNYQVYLSDTLPEGWYYGGVNDDFKRAGDIIIVAKKQYIFGATSAAGVHGYTARGVEEMRATFSAWGPSFKKGVKIKPFENVEIYQLLAEILGLKPAKNDGKGTLSSQVLPQ